jgi:proline dehydrogenase
MKYEGKPVNDAQERAKLHQQIQSSLELRNGEELDFSNTEIAFAYKSDAQLRKAAWLFGMMNKPWLVKLGSKLALLALQLRLPFTKRIIRNTVFYQFCGGQTLLESQKAIDHIYDHGILTILDYGAEGKETEEDFNITMNETIRAIEFASNNVSVPVVSTKLTGMARNGLLEKMSKKVALNAAEQKEWDNFLKRVDAVCHVASQHVVGLYFDAEESWMQPAMDELINKMMARYNRQRAIVHNTFQMYRHDRLAFLKESYEMARAGGYILGAKLVRGAYMDKERRRAAERGYPSPIQADKAATDHDYNEGIRFCVEHYEHIASCNATHNAQSCRLQARLIDEKGIAKNHPHLNFCQLYGMSDHLTFNLANAGYNVAKYLPYGSIQEVMPYLIRRAEENTSVTGDMSRELELITREIQRRRLR